MVHLLSSRLQDFLRLVILRCTFLPVMWQSPHFTSSQGLFRRFPGSALTFKTIPCWRCKVCQISHIKIHTVKAPSLLCHRQSQLEEGVRSEISRCSCHSQPDWVKKAVKHANDLWVCILMTFYFLKLQLFKRKKKLKKWLKPTETLFRGKTRQNNWYRVLTEGGKKIHFYTKRSMTRVQSFTHLHTSTFCVTQRTGMGKGFRRSCCIIVHHGWRWQLSRGLHRRRSFGGCRCEFQRTEIH